MKITQKKLQQIIKEEAHNLLKEYDAKAEFERLKRDFGATEAQLDRLKREFGATEVRYGGGGGNNRVVGASVSVNFKMLSMGWDDAHKIGFKVKWPGGADTPGKVIKAPRTYIKCAGGYPLMLYFFDSQGMLVGMSPDPRMARENACS